MAEPALTPAETAAQRFLADTAATRAMEERREVIESALRYVDERVRWLLAEPSERAARDFGRTSAHNVLIDNLNALSRRMAALGESNEWRRTLGQDRGFIGDAACHVICALGLRAR